MENSEEANQRCRHWERRADFEQYSSAQQDGGQGDSVFNPGKRPRSASRSLDHDLDFAGSTGRTGSGVAEALSEHSENKQVLDPFIANFRVADKKFPV
jgi:hypothetical protein